MDTLIGGLAGAGTDAASYLTPMFDFSKVVAPTLDPAAMAGVVAPLAEDGANATSSMLPGLAGVGTKIGNFFTGTNIPAENVGAMMNAGGAFDSAKNMITDAAGNTYKVMGDGSLQGSGIFGKTLDFMGTNSKGLEAGGKLVGSLGGLYYQNQMSGLAKQQLKDSRENTAYNRAKEARAAADLQSASDRVFGKYNV